jgi:hypothetical protein
VRIISWIWILRFVQQKRMAPFKGPSCEEEIHTYTVTVSPCFATSFLMMTDSCRVIDLCSSSANFFSKMWSSGSNATLQNRGSFFLGMCPPLVIDCSYTIWVQTARSLLLNCFPYSFLPSKRRIYICVLPAVPNQTFFLQSG